jgi:NADPH:quinone reductase-like Zn-dependent oxidoreductase
MRAVQYMSALREPALVEVEVARPAAGAGELLIEVRDAGVTPSELMWYPTTHTKDGGARTGAIPGHEFAGVVAAVGAGVTGFAVGDEVYGMNDWFSDGATAEYCVAAPAGIAKKPERLSYAEAAAVPIGALTAWQGLVERAKIKAGERVLVHGASGAVGVFVLQIARMRGAQVIATAAARNAEFVKGLGASEVIDYAAGPFEDQVDEMDVVFDGVGGETLKRSWGVLKKGGRMVTIAADSEGTKDQRVKDAFFIVESNPKQLAEIGGLLDAGKMKVFVDMEIPLASAPAAYARKMTRKRGIGKVVVRTSG